MHTAIPLPAPCKRAPWSKGCLIGQKRPLKPKDVSFARLLGSPPPQTSHRQTRSPTGINAAYCRHISGTLWIISIINYLILLASPTGFEPVLPP
jgi:hypothetical protein